MHLLLLSHSHILSIPLALAMLASPAHPLLTEGVQLCQSLITSNTPSEWDVQRWLTYATAVTASLSGGTLDQSTVSGIMHTVENVRIIASTRGAMEEELDQEIQSLTSELETLTFKPDHREYVCKEAS